APSGMKLAGVGAARKSSVDTISQTTRQGGPLNLSVSMIAPPLVLRRGQGFALDSDNKNRRE
ncbi:MAG: hypothetical protein ABIV36_14810, partial [Sphingobium limneticum]